MSSFNQTVGLGRGSNSRGFDFGSNASIGSTDVGGTQTAENRRNSRKGNKAYFDQSKRLRPIPSYNSFMSAILFFSIHHRNNFLGVERLNSTTDASDPIESVSESLTQYGSRFTISPPKISQKSEICWSKSSSSRRWIPEHIRPLATRT
jgi:hypothetical protein